MTFSRGGKVVSGSTITAIATLAGVCLGLGEWDEEVKISDEQRARVRNVSNKLSSMGYTVLTNYSSNDDWNDVLRWYNSSWRKEGELFEGSERQKETRNSLKRRCILRLAEESETSNNLSLVKRWCVKPESIADVLGRIGYQRIGDSSGSNENKEKWKSKVEEFKKLREEGPKNIELEVASASDENMYISALEKMCTDLNIDRTKTNIHTDFESKLEKAKEWCFWK